MALLISTWTSLCFCLCNAVSLETTAMSFPKNAVENVQIYINIVNPLDTGVLVNISAPRISSFTTKQELVPPKDVVVIEIDTTDFEITGTGKSGKGILIQSNVSDLIITGLSTASGSGDMYFGRKASQLGTEHIIITYCIREYICQLTVIADEDNTVIQIIFPGYSASAVLFDGTYYGPGDVMTSTLQKSQTFHIQSTSDLSGVKIISTNEQRFSVLSGSSLTSVRTGDGRDHIVDMVPPIAAWGSEYVLVRRNLLQYGHDYVKFVATASGANISIIGCGHVLYDQILKFQTYSFNMTCERVHVISDEPVLIAHFPVGVDHGDPAMFFPTPINHYVSGYTVYIPPGFRFCSIACVIETRHVNAFNLGIFTGSFTNWQEIEESVYSTTWVDGVSSGVIEISHTSPFGGHVICEDVWTIIAFPIGPGNWTQTETQEYFSTSTIAESSTTQRFNETLINASLTEALESTTGSTAPNDITSFSSKYVNTDDSESTYSGASTSGTNDVTVSTSGTNDVTVSTSGTNDVTVSTSGTNDVTVSTNAFGNVTTSQTHSNKYSSTSTMAIAKSSTVANVHETVMDASVGEPMSNCSCCMTPSHLDLDLPPPEILLETINDLRKTLSVPKKTTSNYVRKLTSAWDKRTSSAVIGTVGVVVLSVVFGSIIAIDIATLFQNRR